MSGRDGRRLVAASTAALLALSVLGAGLCLFDHDGDGVADHAMPQDLCWVMLVVPAGALTVSGLVPRGAVASPVAHAFITVPRLVLDPPPRPRFRV